MKHITDMLKVPPPAKSHRTQRGDLLKYFAEKLNSTIPRVARNVQHLTDLQDLYFLKSDCDQAEHRGVPWAAAFGHALRVAPDPTISYKPPSRAHSKNIPNTHTKTA